MIAKIKCSYYVDAYVASLSNNSNHSADDFMWALSCLRVDRKPPPLVLKKTQIGWIYNNSPLLALVFIKKVLKKINHTKQ